MIKLNNVIIEQNKFPDGTLLMKNTEKTDFEGNKIYWKYENDGELFALICLVKSIRENNKDAFIWLHMPYIPHARQDRVKNPEDIFTLKYFCEVINSLNFNSVYVMDAHSNVSLALLDRVVEIKPNHTIVNAMNDIPNDKPLVIFYPDEGAMKRYSGMIAAPYAFGIKKRKWETGEIEGLDIAGATDKIKDANILIVDDICSKGGTFYYSALALQELGAANIYLYVTHCEDTIHKGDLLKTDLIKHIYTTDSILTKKHDKITIVE